MTGRWIQFDRFLQEIDRNGGDFEHYHGREQLSRRTGQIRDSYKHEQLIVAHFVPVGHRVSLCGAMGHERLLREEQLRMSTGMPTDLGEFQFYTGEESGWRHDTTRCPECWLRGSEIERETSQRLVTALTAHHKLQEIQR